jgi:hypothetical protein
MLPQSPPHSCELVGLSLAVAHVYVCIIALKLSVEFDAVAHNILHIQVHWLRCCCKEEEQHAQAALRWLCSVMYKRSGCSRDVGTLYTIVTCAAQCVALQACCVSFYCQGAAALYVQGRCVLLCVLPQLLLAP